MTKSYARAAAGPDDESTGLAVGEPLLCGINHVAVLTADSDRLHVFYRDVFGASVWHDATDGDTRLSFLTLGPHTQLNVFQIAGNSQARSQAPMFDRGRLDHVGLEAASQSAFEEIRRRLVVCGASDGFVTDFGLAHSVFFRDPDGLECEVCLHDAAATPADLKPPGTPAAGYRKAEVLPARAR